MHLWTCSQNRSSSAEIHVVKRESTQKSKKRGTWRIAKINVNTLKTTLARVKHQLLLLHTHLESTLAPLSCCLCSYQANFVQRQHADSSSRSRDVKTLSFDFNVIDSAWFSDWIVAIVLLLLFPNKTAPWLRWHHQLCWNRTSRQSEDFHKN